MKEAFPVANVLLAQRRVQTECVAGGGDVGGGRAFPEHLLDGISGDQVNQKEDEADHQPDHWEGVENALEEALGHRMLVVDRSSLVVHRSSARLAPLVPVELRSTGADGGYPRT